MTTNIDGFSQLIYSEIFLQLDSESLKSLSLVNQMFRKMVADHSYLRTTYELKGMDPKHIFLQLLDSADFHDTTKTASQIVLSFLEIENVTAKEVDEVSKWVPDYLKRVVEYANKPVGDDWHEIFGNTGKQKVVFETLDGLASTLLIKRGFQKKYPNHIITFNPYINISDTSCEFSTNWFMADGINLSTFEDQMMAKD